MGEAYEKSEDEICLVIAGHTKPLFYTPGMWRCGGITDGLSFRFGGDGSWVISLETLRRIVATEDNRRAKSTAPMSDNVGQ